MEKKTIGSFIAALRRASGMTQKELAEKLYVSDKTVSRWECDESAPDLSLIPVIADIFGITSDELLRGERRNSDHISFETEVRTSERRDRSEKAFKALLLNRLNSFKNLSWISIGVAIFGFFIALICNFGFLRAIIGFCLGSFVILASVICQICFINIRYFRNDDENFSDLINDFNFNVYRLSRKVFLLDVALFCLILPFLIDNVYAGLPSDAWLLLGACIALPITLFAVIFSETFIFKKLVKRGTIVPATTETEICEKKIRFLKKRLPIHIVIAIVLCVLMVFASNMPHYIAKPIIFEDYESFKEYMAMPIEFGYQYEDDEVLVQIAPSETDFSVNEQLPDDEYEDDDYDYYSEIEVLDNNRNVLFTYIKRNENVDRIKFSDSPDKLPIKVYTYESWSNAQEISGIVCTILALGVLADAITFFAVYFFKLNKND